MGYDDIMELEIDDIDRIDRQIRESKYEQCTFIDR